MENILQLLNVVESELSGPSGILRVVAPANRAPDNESKEEDEVNIHTWFTSMWMNNPDMLKDMCNAKDATMAKERARKHVTSRGQNNKIGYPMYTHALYLIIWLQQYAELSVAHYKQPLSKAFAKWKAEGGKLDKLNIIRNMTEEIEATKLAFGMSIKMEDTGDGQTLMLGPSKYTQDEMTCPICMNVVGTGRNNMVTKCFNNHLSCKACVEQSDYLMCPSCREHRMIRDPMITSIISLYTETCNNKGCDTVYFKSDKQKHVSECEFKPIGCFMCSCPVAATDYKKHITESCRPVTHIKADKPYSDLTFLLANLSMTTADQDSGSSDVEKKDVETADPDSDSDDSDDEKKDETTDRDSKGGQKKAICYSMQNPDLMLLMNTNGKVINMMLVDFSTIGLERNKDMIFTFTVKDPTNPNLTNTQNMVVHVNKPGEKHRMTTVPHSTIDKPHLVFGDRGGVNAPVNTIPIWNMRGRDNSWSRVEILDVIEGEALLGEATSVRVAYQSDLSRTETVKLNMMGMMRFRRVDLDVDPSDRLSPEAADRMLAQLLRGARIRAGGMIIAN